MYKQTEINIHNIPVTLQRKLVKNINLRIQRSGEVQVSAPLRMPLSVIYDFLHSKHSWIDKQRHRLQKLTAVESQNRALNDSILFQGLHYQVVVHEMLTHEYVDLSDQTLHFFIKPNATLAHKQVLLTHWYHAKMQQCLPALFAKWESIIGVSTNKISIRRMKSRWGSCHPIKKHITLNLALIEKPLSCLEYVIVHELVHLLEASHNQRFYALMDSYLPHWRHEKKQLNYS